MTTILATPTIYNATGSDAAHSRRTRYQRGKSRFGCRECKSKRLKCDETHPKCKNCFERDVECSGFIQPLRWSGKHERFGPGRAPVDQTTTDSSIPVYTPNVESIESSNLRAGAASPMHTARSSTTRGALASSPQRKMVHFPAALIGVWFANVCPVWSTFDSHVNFNRRLASDTWTSSKPVFYALQAMSAAYLLDTTPHLRDVLYWLTQQAMSAVAEQMSIVQHSSSSQVDVGLVFAVFAIGTSSHWTDMSPSTESMLDSASDLLHRWKVNEKETAIATFLYAYFEQALVYWQMLQSLSKHEARNGRLDLRRTLYHSRYPPSSDSARGSGIQGPGQLHTSLEGTRPNSWCGVSGEVIDIFGQILILCRSVRERCRANGSVMRESIACADLCDIHIAKQLHDELSTLDFDALVDLNELLGYSMQTEDINTPISHLVLTAETYRLASLLQLYLTFNDFEIEPLGCSVASTSTCWKFHSRVDQISSFAIHMTSVLEQIPPESGSKSIHPMLYISAAAGLLSNPASTGTGMDLSLARQLVISRLELLRYTLPSRPISIALKLVRAIWENHDKSGTDCGQHVHWLDIMSDTGLQTLFG